MRERKILYLSRGDVEKAGVAMADIIAAVEDMFREKAAGRTEMPPKIGIHTRPDAFIHAMPAYLPKTGSAGLKWVSGYPENRGRGLPYISGLIVW
ncbi:MAG: ornithine cyclodeaminase family protein, partial [Candidatus Aminicenantes bacterium]|nr:ornithine cyclodeaminase family protein [Candidatus Aminicenantes bacterium]